MSQKHEVTKFCIIILLALILVSILIINISAVNLNINSGSSIKRCYLTCIKDSKNITKQCDSNLRESSKILRTNYENCLNNIKGIRNMTLIRQDMINCSLNFKNNRDIVLSTYNECKNNIINSCNDKCINQTTNNTNNQTDNSSNNHVLPNGQIDCDWRPYRDSNGCYSIFGSRFVKLLSYAPPVCIGGDAILGSYFNGNSCSYASGFQVEGNFTLFKNIDECEQKCMNINCNWRPSQDISCKNKYGTYPCITTDQNFYYFNGTDCLISKKQSFDGKILFQDLPTCQQCLLPKDNGDIDFCRKDSDCTIIQTGCANYISINSKYKENFTGQYTGKPCLSVTSPNAWCNNNKCVVVYLVL